MNKNSFILSFLLILSFYYSAFASDNLRGINSFFIGSEEMSGDKKKDCNLDKNKIIRSVKYLILEAKIPTTESYENNEVLYIQPIVLKAKNICAGMITFQTFSFAEVANSGGNKDYMQLISYNETKLVTGTPSDFADFYLKILEEMTLEFINKWEKAN